MAQHLAQKSLSIREGVVKTSNGVVDIAHKAFSDQFDGLISRALSENNNNTRIDLIVVINTLGEIDGDLDIEKILNLFRHLGQINSNMHLRLFMTSTPEVPVRLGFS